MTRRSSSSARTWSRWSSRAIAIALGIALPTVLLGLGWLAASLRERETLAREQRLLLTRSADAIRGAIDESLEEMRRREDGRPFYLYNHFYSPPEVIAINDPVAVSPLASEPTDPRIVGHFQIDPGGAVRTPYEIEPGSKGSRRALAVTSRVSSPGLGPLRALAVRSPDAPSSSSPSSLVAGGEIAAPADAGSPVVPPRRVVRRARIASTRDRDAGQASSAQASLTPQGPLTVTLNQWSTQVYEDIHLAQSGSAGAYARVQQRGRSAPITTRNQVDWNDVPGGAEVYSQAQQVPSQAQQAQQVEDPPAQRAARQNVPARRQATQGQVTFEYHDPASTGAVDRATRARARAQSSRAVQLVAATESRSAGAEPLPTLAQAATDVGYTQMVWNRFGGMLVMHRVVTHQGTSSVQGLVLDIDYLLRDWMPAVAARHRVTGLAPRVVSRAAAAGCGVAIPASRVIEEAVLCFPGSGIEPALARVDDALHLQAGLLAGLVAIVAIAAFVVHRAGRRSDELAAQRSAFVSAISHELRTPLTTIRMHAEMLKEGLVSEEKRDRFYGDLVTESMRLSRLVERVLEVTRLEEGRRPLRKTPGDVAEHVRAILGDQKALLEAKRFALQIEAPEDGALAAFEPDALEQIVVNLIENAVKYAASGTERVVRVVIELVPGRVVLHVMDRGPGIPSEERVRIFERFHRVERAETAHTPGTGLGLALVRDLARAHGGDAEARPRDGGGADMVVWLPA